MAQRTENHAETGRRFALALAGMDDPPDLFLGLCRLYLVAGGFLLAHLVRMAGVQLLLGHRKKFSDFSAIYRPFRIQFLKMHIKFSSSKRAELERGVQNRSIAYVKLGRRLGQCRQVFLSQ